MSEEKNILRRFLKENNLATSLGEIENMRQIGEGGNGLVYEGTLYQEPIAIKFLVNPDERKLTRFKAECFNIMLLPENPFVARPLLYDEFSIDEESYPAILFKKYDNHLRRPTVPSAEEIHKLLDFLIDALSFIHVQGIIHRDIKPENILVKNSEFVLTDFGIANYNPDIFKLRAETRKGERLANYLFSAPEQAEGDVSPNPAKDIFALGQIIQWYATGSIHRGTQRTLISSIIPGTEAIDSLIDKCLANDPTNRFQSAAEIRAAMKEFLESRQRKSVLDYLRLFSDAIGNAFPRGIGKVNYSEDKRVINRLITNLSQTVFDSELWWSEGNSGSYAYFYKLDEETWVMGSDPKKPHGYEIKIKSVWTYFDVSFHGDLILLNLEAMPPFDVGEEVSLTIDDDEDYVPIHEAAIVDDSFYVTRAEYDNSFAQVGDEVINLSEHKIYLRIRFLRPHSIFIGTAFNSILQRESEDEAAELVKRFDRGEPVTEEEFRAFVRSIRRNRYREVRR